MATRASATTVAISQMPKLAVPSRTAELPVVVGVTNYSTTIDAIVKLTTKDSIGLPKVENLAPSEMPVSVAQQAAFDQKLGKNDPIPQSQVTGLVPRLEALEAMNGDIPLSRIPQFTPGVQAIIDAQPKAEQDVVQGAHVW